MAETKRYFLKHLVNNLIYFADGTRIPFTHGAEDTGFMALDSAVPDDQKKIVELEAFMKRRSGGVEEVGKARFQDEEKKSPSSRVGSGMRGGPRLLEEKRDPFRTHSRAAETPGHAALVTAQAVAHPAAAGNPAPDVAAQEKPKTFTPKRGTPKARKA